MTSTRLENEKETKPWPTVVVKKNTQIEKLIILCGFDIPEGGLTFQDIPFKENEWWKKFSNYDCGNSRKIVHRGIVFCCYLNKIKNMIALEKEKITEDVLMDFYLFLEKSEVMNTRGMFEWNYAVESTILAALNYDLKKLEGSKRVYTLLKKIESFSGEVTSVDPYQSEMFKRIFVEHPEDGNELPKKMYMLSRIISPVRMKFSDSMVFEHFTHDPEKKIMTFFKPNSKSGLGHFVVTDYKKNSKFSLYRLFEKYLSQIGMQYRKGGFWRFYTPSQFKGGKGFYGPGKRWKTDDFPKIRREMEARYLDSFPADVFVEETTGKKLDRASRFSNLNENKGLDRYGEKSARKC